MKYIYIADDGTQFNNYDECEEYEQLAPYQGKLDTTAFWNSNGLQMSANEFLHDPDECFYMEVCDDNEGRVIDDFLQNYVKTDVPWNVDATTYVGRYYYSVKDYAWHSLDEELGALRTIMEVFEG